jgi:myo-inositol-1(or 4)-monophosphatase
VQGEIGRLFPEDGVLGEEATGDERRALEARYCWVLDPIDGTNNFGRRLPGFAVSIGILRDGAPFAGAVYDPIADWLFAARRGVGAWLNGEALTATPSPLSSRSLFAMRAPFEDGVPAFVEAWLRRYRLRRFGSTALHLCYVAFGGLAFAHDHRASLWDIAGAASVLLEAGGVLTRPDGSSVFPFDPARIDEPIGLVAANTEAHHTVLADIERELASSAR